MDKNLLVQTAQAMVKKGKGILAIDESSSTCKKRFDAVGVDCTEENRRAYRELLITAPGVEQYISGMILYDETLRQSTKAGVSFVKALNDKGMIAGIKVDMGPKPLALHEGEVCTEGLDGLRERLTEYFKIGARFAKWRAVINIGKDLPSVACLKANTHALARYAALCQEAGLVPMVEPEIMIEGDHTIEKCYEVTAGVLKMLFAELKEQGVMFEGAVLKVSMVISGLKCAVQADVRTVAEQTNKCLVENVPANLAGVVFLSGGQSDEAATLHLNEMNKIGGLPWPLSFSYGRAIQSAALKIWAAAKMGEVEKAQKTIVHRSKCNAFAALGKYDSAVEAEM